MKVLTETCDICGAEIKTRLVGELSFRQTSVVGYYDVCSACVEHAIRLIRAQVEDGKWKGSKQ